MINLHRIHARVDAAPAPAKRQPNACAAAAPAEVSSGARCRRLQSADLMGSDAEIEIQHGDALYRLRLTSLGKLILTK